MALIQLGQGLYANYEALTSKSQYEVYFTTDTHQIFVGADEYTKSTKVLAAEPVDGTTSGEQGCLYAYNGSLYLCTSAADKTWLRVANINDTDATVTSIEVGEGLTTASGSTSITTTDTVKHAVPTGASTVTDSMTDQTPAFGSTFAIQGVSTDKFGHVTAVNTHAVTVPTQTAVSVAAGSTSAATLTPGGSFTVVTGVARSQDSGATDHDLVYTTETLTLPQDQNVTYTISSDSEGVVTLTGSDTSSSTAVINGWDQLAKKSDITAVFRYKGSVASVADLPQTAGVQVGDVYQIQGTDKEYVCVDNTTPGSFVWEELGSAVDLSAYATTAYVDSKVTWHTF